MSVVGEMIASAVVKQITSRLIKFAIEEVTLQWKFKGEVDKMAEKMKDLAAVMHDADDRLRRGEKDGEAVGRWLTKLKSVSYDVEDVLDDLETQNSQAKLCKAFQLITRPHKMETVRKKIDELEMQQQALSLGGREARFQGSTSNESFAAINEIGMVGRDTEKDKIIDLLLRSEADEDISIIPIIGIGGIGKTTLARSIFTDKKVKVFNIRSWVHVSKEFDLYKIGIAIMKNLNCSINLDNCNLQFLYDNLKKDLATTRYLIVLDDLWEEDGDKLEDLKLMLQHGSKGSKIMVTTRNLSVVKKLCTGVLANQRKLYPVPESSQINLGILSPRDCWEVMQQRAFGPCDDRSGLEEIGMQIAEKCAGLPLVVTALGQVMSELRNADAWKDIRDTKVDLGLRHVHQKKALECLMLSYYHMMLEFKMCFTYLAAFPVGFVINTDRLIQQWNALGYIYSGFDGQSCINYLLGMSFLQLSESSLASPSSMHAKSPLGVIMHDLVHELASIITADEFIILDADDTKPRDWNKTIHCRHAQLIKYKNQSGVFRDLPGKLRSLHIRNSQLQLPDKAFSGPKYIRVLDLSFHQKIGDIVEGQSTPIRLPSSMKKLKLLRYFDATGLPVASLPKSFYTLQNMRTLILSDCSLETLSDNISSLHKLCYLDLSRNSSLSKLPVSLASLPKLVLLNLSGCSRLTKLPESVNLESLKHLDLSSCHKLENLPQDFGNLHNLVFLSLSDCYKVSVLPESFCRLIHLKDLDFSDCHDLSELPHCFGNLSDLEYLNLTSCSKLQWLPESFCNMIKLKHLNLSYCVRLEKLPSSFGDLKLQILDISSSMMLTDLPDSICNMASLIQFIVMSGHHRMYEKAEDIKKHLNFPRWTRHDVQEIGNSGGSTIVELQKLTCHELAVGHLQNVKLIEEAERVKLCDKADLRLLGLHWEWGLRGSMLPKMKSDAARYGKSVLERLLPPRTLEQIIIDGYISKDFPDWMCHISSYLPSLTLEAVQMEAS